jgi:hypothetical protein
MLKNIQHFGKQCSWHLQGDYVMNGRFWRPYVGQAVGSEMDFVVLIGGGEERPAKLLQYFPPTTLYLNETP